MTQDDESGPAHLQGPTRILALISVGLGILAVTLLPVRQGLLARLRAGGWRHGSFADIVARTQYTGPGDILFNVMLFLPFGFLAAPWGGPREGARRRALAALSASLTLSAAVEFVQMTVPGRYPSLLDLAANGLGGLLGQLLAERLIRRSL